MKKKSKLLIAIFVILFLIISIIIGSVIYIKSSLKPTKEFLSGEVCEFDSPCEVTGFMVDEGAYGLTTLQKLEDKGIIKNANIVYYWNRILGGYSFYAGYYNIPHKIEGNDINLSQLLGYLSNPNNAEQDTVTIKLDEGDFVRSFASVIAEDITLKENPEASEYEKEQMIYNYWNDRDVVRSYMEDYPFLTEDIFDENVRVLLEGYLFPDTYEFFELSSLDELTRKILDRTLDVYEEYEDAFNNSKLSTHEIFTLASIVQWETGDAEDSKLVAGSLLNRMDNPEHEGTGGRFQSTVTACYAFNLDKEECYLYGDTTEYTEREDLYNTYTVKGFPPGPVCCPNETAIYAALYPDQDAGYYFFVADMCNGGTSFAVTYAQHINNINKYYLPCSE